MMYYSYTITLKHIYIQGVHLKTSHHGFIENHCLKEKTPRHVKRFAKGDNFLTKNYFTPFYPLPPGVIPLKILNDKGYQVIACLKGLSKCFILTFDFLKSVDSFSRKLEKSLFILICADRKKNTRKYHFLFQ